MPFWKNILTTAGATILFATSLAHADVFTFRDNLNFLPSAGLGTAITPLTLTNSDLGLTQFRIGSGSGIAQATVNTAAASQGEGVVKGNRPYYYADLVTGGTGAKPTFYTQPYFSTGTGVIDLKFNQGQAFLGLLWGSVDQSNQYGGKTAPNSITFLRNGIDIGSVTGDNIQSQTGVNTAGSQTFGGSYYLMINDTSGKFNEAVLTSGVRSFEAASFESSTGNVTVPETGSLELLGTAILLLGLVTQHKSVKKALPDTVL